MMIFIGSVDLSLSLKITLALSKAVLGAEVLCR
jgi:hypothetical protein